MRKKPTSNILIMNDRSILIRNLQIAEGEYMRMEDFQKLEESIPIIINQDNKDSHEQCINTYVVVLT